MLTLHRNRLMVALLGWVAAAAMSAEILTAVGDGNVLIAFDHAAPGTTLSSNPITGLQSGEQILAIDFRPASGQLYALGSSSRLYVVDPSTYVATPVGAAPFTPSISGARFGLDFNPTVDRIRLVSDAEQNLRLHPDTGALAGIDAALAYAAGDPGSGADPSVTAVAYTNSVAGATSTTLYAIDEARDTLVRIGSLGAAPVSPNSGQLFTVGALGSDAGSATAFDISSATGVAFAAFSPAGAPGTGLYTVDLSTGTSTFLGVIAGTAGIHGLAVVQAPVLFTLPVIGRVQGLNDTLFRTDLSIVNGASFPATARLDFYASSTTAGSGPTTSVDLTFAPGEQKFYPDLVGGLFATPSSTGALRITSSRPLGIVAYVYNDQRATDGGTNGTLLRGFEESDRRTSGILPGIQNAFGAPGADFSANLGFFNPGTSDATVTLTVHDAAGATLTTAERVVPAVSHQQVALTDVFPALSTVSNAYIRFTATGNLFVYSAAVDNTTGDSSVTASIRN